ncbi:MAG: cyclic pyranopterin monophosphate synthase MoaC [Pseudomonadota bacterium]|nr:cyclic pyranopterin monophosphate synthase MoaC [Pseudomonadota bacterium]|tara:strand:- start:235 stop:714 length:480 start_codon:yes stop_codon:yes gene_type:complete
MKKSFTHFTKSGDAQMVDIYDKDITERMAVASGKIYMSNASIEMVRDGTHKKGDVLGIARIAGITASKKTPDLIPLCHNIELSSVNIDFEVNTPKKYIECFATVSCCGRTGVEMEALTSVQISLLTIYDMCKSVDRGMIISDIKLELKKGGASGEWERK